MGSSRLAAAAVSALVALLVGCDPTPVAEPPFQIALQDLPAGLLSVHGRSARDVWTVGGAVDDGAGEPLVLHYDGEMWERRSTGIVGRDLWWVHALSDGTVLMGGERGTILRYAGSAFTEMTTPSASPIVFGIWAAAPDDAWAVGGAGASNGFAWHWDGASWEVVPLPAGFSGAALFKVWGRASDDVWICGLSGTLMHWDGSALSLVESGTTRSLFTVHVSLDEAVAVGGAGSGVLIARDSSAEWHDVAPALVPQMNGVWITEDDGYSVGISGQVLRRRGGVWDFEDTGTIIPLDLHGVWMDPDGGVWTVGGNIVSEPLTDGIVVHRGEPIATTIRE